MKEPPVQLKAALDIYCEWLNKWTAAEPFDDHHNYVPDQFLTAPYASWDDCGHLGGGYYAVYHYLISDGDEGGPHELTVWWREDDGKVAHIVQGFDTYVQSVYDQEKGFLATP